MYYSIAIGVLEIVMLIRDLMAVLSWVDAEHRCRLTHGIPRMHADGRAAC